MTAPAPVVIDITLPPLHDRQRLILKDPSRFKVVCAGRRFGKTMLGMVACIAEALKGGRTYWVAPQYKTAMEGWNYLMSLVAQMPRNLAKPQISELIVHFATGGSIQVRTADNPDNLRGAGLDGIVLDEYATMNPRVWGEVVRPALADKQGWAMFISTPQHFNHFYDLFSAAEQDATGTWAAWQHPTWDNPFINEDEIDAARRDMTDEDFDQEFGASFTAVGGAIFRKLSADRPIYLRPMPAGLEFRRTGVGMDWGTTEAHKSAVVCGSVMSSGVIWIRSAWLSSSGSSDQWRDEAVRCKRDYGATFARVDRSQSSEIDRLTSKGFEAQTGIANVEARIGDFQGLVLRQAIFFDSSGPGVREYYNHLAAYHRDRDGKVVEAEDDDVDAGCYLVSDLAKAPLAMGGLNSNAIAYAGKANRGP